MNFRHKNTNTQNPQKFGVYFLCLCVLVAVTTDSYIISVYKIKIHCALTDTLIKLKAILTT